KCRIGQPPQTLADAGNFIQPLPRYFQRAGKARSAGDAHQEFLGRPPLDAHLERGLLLGEEPYTIAITVADAFESTETWNVQILATDISRQALDIAERGIYPRRELETLKPHQFTNYFTQQSEHTFKVRPKIRNMVTFAPL